MSLRDGKWTSYPNDEQIRREANREYWKFICPECGNGCMGTMHNLRTDEIICLDCRWTWFDPMYHSSKNIIQTLLESF